MNPDLWTWEQHPAGWDPTVTAWHAVAPRNDPSARLPDWYRFARVLDDGRTAYPLVGPHHARQVAETANAKIGAP